MEDEKRGGDEVKNEEGLELKEVDIAAAEDDEEDQPLKKDDKKQEEEEEPMEAPKNKKKKEPVFPKLYEVAESTTLTQWSFVKVLLYFALGLMALTVMMEPSKIVDCNQQTVARWPLKIACIKANATFTCKDSNALACKSQCSYPQLCQIPLSAPNQDNPPFVICLTLDSFQTSCVDTDSCTTDAKSSIFLAYVILAGILFGNCLLELMFALFAGAMSQYTEEDFSLNEGWQQKASIAIVKTVPLLTFVLHLAFVGVLGWVYSVNDVYVKQCSLALTTAGATSTIQTRATLFWYVWISVWAALTLIGFWTRTNLKLNEFLFSPTDEIPRNGNVIDWDCPQLRYRRDPTEENPGKRLFQLFMYNLMKGIIRVSGIVYFLIANRKNLGA